MSHSVHLGGTYTQSVDTSMQCWTDIRVEGVIRLVYVPGLFSSNCTHTVLLQVIAYHP